MLSKSAQYAVKALVYLASHSDVNNKVLAARLAAQVDVPKPFLSKILQQFSAADIVSAVKGPRGGFYLTPKQKQNSLYEIMVVADGKDILGRCVLGLHQCDSENPCTIHHLIVDSKTALRDNLASISLAEIAQKDSNSA